MKPSFNSTLLESIMETCSVGLTFGSVDEILWCDHSNETSLAVLLHGAICFSIFYKMKFEIFLEFWYLALLGAKELIHRREATFRTSETEYGFQRSGLEMGTHVSFITWCLEELCSVKANAYVAQWYSGSLHCYRPKCRTRTTTIYFYFFIFNFLQDLRW